MSIFITQGHEQGIGLEVFFKSSLLLPERVIQQFILLAYEETVRATLDSLKIPFKILEDSILLTSRTIKVQWLKEIDHSQSFTALNLGMKLAEIDGILYTLPTSKDQFPGFAGHTEYFRAFYRLPELGMFFSSPDLKVLLISDHIALADVASLCEEVIYTRLDTALSVLKKWKWPLQRVLIAGFNPHAGEGGLIGQEDGRINQVIKRLRSRTAFPMAGPLPGDTMLLEKKSSQDLLVYLYHDQGLGVFKGAQGFIGSNITLGLNYPRFSPDHGTSFGLYGKNTADYRGCAYSLKEAFFLLETMANGKNTSNQS
jgi:4-hydroxythreonine-4-phosphate dehydrogenase